MNLDFAIKISIVTGIIVSPSSSSYPVLWSLPGHQARQMSSLFCMWHVSYCSVSWIVQWHFAFTFHLCHFSYTMFIGLFFEWALNSVLVLVTDRCVLKMDHHCPWWVRCGLLAPKLNLLKINVKNTLLTSLFLSIFYRVNNCVGFSNYKFFILFLTYSLVYCLFIAASVLQYFIKFWTVSISLTFHYTYLRTFTLSYEDRIIMWIEMWFQQVPVCISSMC